MEYKVSENFISLALNPKSGNFMIIGNWLTYGIIGSVMMDLTLGRRIGISDNRIHVIPGSGISGIIPHDRMLERFKKSKGNIRISHWLRKLSMTAAWYRREIIKLLVASGRVKKVRKRFLFIPYNSYYVADITRYRKLVQRLKDIILYGKEADESELMTLGLVFACKLHRVLASESSDRQKIRKSLKKLIKERPIASGIDQAIREMQAAITLSITAAAVASSGH